MTDPELRQALEEILASDRPHVERMTIAAAIISEALRRRGMEATLVGGGAIEFYAPAAYTTSDIDLVVEGRTREELGKALAALGFARAGRHWLFGDLYVEVPGNWMSDPTETFAVGAFTLRVVRAEVVLADRIIGFKHWRVAAYGAQAMALMVALGETLDEGYLRRRLREEGADDAYQALAALVAAGAAVSDERLRAELDRLHGRPARDREERDEP